MSWMTGAKSAEVILSAEEPGGLEAARLNYVNPQA